jgi:hypothetical protein
MFTAKRHKTPQNVYNKELIRHQQRLRPFGARGATLTSHLLAGGSVADDINESRDTLQHVHIM